MAVVTFKANNEKFRRFSREMVRGMDAKTAELVTRLLAVDATNRVIKRTPVDQGRARASWSPIMTANHVPVKIDGPEVNASAIRQGVSEGEFSQKRTPAGFGIVVTSGVPYIRRLEYGYSEKAPSGMVRISLFELMQSGAGAKAVIEGFKDLLAETNVKVR